MILQFTLEHIYGILLILAIILGSIAAISPKFKMYLFSFILAGIAIYMFWTIIHLANTTSIYR
jgi:predicted MFS family arabinose efflux permease